MRIDSDPIELFLWVCDKPGMYVHSHSIDAVWAFIEGYDFACGGEPLQGFREWLVNERGEWTNLPWFMLIRERVYPDTASGSLLTEDEHMRLREELGQCLLKFKTQRDKDGLRPIFVEHEKLVPS